MTQLVTSPLGLYYIGGVVVHSDEGPQAAVRWVQLNEGHAFVDTVGAIMPDSSVIFRSDRPEHPVLYFNARTRKLQLENACLSGRDVLGLREASPRGHGMDFDKDGWIPVIAPTNGPGFLVWHCQRETKLDAYMAAFEAAQEV